MIISSNARFTVDHSGGSDKPACEVQVHLKVGDEVGGGSPAQSTFRID